MTTTELTPLTKKDFKQLHDGGELALVAALNWPLDKTREAVEDKLAEGVNLADYGRNTSRADIDGKGVTIHYDESNGVIYAAGVYDSETYGRTYTTVVYIIR